MAFAKTPCQGEAAVARLLGMTRFWNYVSDWIESRVHLRPEKDNALDLGSSDYRWRSIYTSTVIGARVYNDAAITVGDATWTVLTFNTERFDTDGMHSTSTNTGRLTCVTPGTYLVSGSIMWPGSAGGTARGLRIMLDGTTRLASELRPIIDGALGPQITIQAIYQLTAGQYVTLDAYQNTGGDLDVAAAAAYSPEFAMVRLA